MEVSENTRKLLKCLRGRVAERRTHAWPHPDELFALWLLERFGLERFPGNAEAPMVPVTNNGTPDGRPAAWWFEERGVLFVGCASSLFDDHRLTEPCGARPFCSADLVAISLGVETLPTLRPLLCYVRENDCTGKRYGSFDLSTLIDDLNAVSPTDPQRVYDLVREILDAFYAIGLDERVFKTHVSSARKVADEFTVRWLVERFGEAGATEPSADGRAFRAEAVAASVMLDRFPEVGRILRYMRGFVLGGNRQGPRDLAAILAVLLAASNDRERTYTQFAELLDAKRAAEQQFLVALEEFRKDVRIASITTLRDCHIRLGVIESDTRKITEAGYYDGCDALVVKRSNGHVYIGIQQQVGFSLDLVVRFLRALEQKFDRSIDSAYRELGYDELGVPGFMESSQRWFYHREAKRLLNGSLAYPNVEPTKLHLRTIEKFVRIGLPPFSETERRNLWARFLREERLVDLPKRLLRRLEPKRPLPLRRSKKLNHSPVASSV